jgi:hypothetical protein
MSENDYQERIRKLEEELARERKEKLFHKENARALMEHAFPMEPLTPEEEQRLMTDIGGEPIADILAELEKELQG